MKSNAKARIGENPIGKWGKIFSLQGFQAHLTSHACDSKNRAKKQNQPNNKGENLMKKAICSLFAALIVASPSFAGVAVTSGKTFKGPVPVEPCFKDHELQLDVFGSYVDTQGGGTSDGFGGGLAANYFFTRCIGVGVDGSWHGTDQDLWSLSARLIARWPLELNNSTLCLAPYVFGGGGGQWGAANEGQWYLGGGLEYRATRKIGIFSEGRYTWAGADDSNVQVRIGVRFVF
jgi:hypothetical protein